MQGNVADLCPVGALTSQALRVPRPPVGADQDRIHRRDGRGRLRDPRRHPRQGSDARDAALNEEVNEEWISDKTRFIWDGLRTQRLDRPYARKDGRLQPVTWAEAFRIIADKVKAASADRIGALAGQLSGVEDMFALKSLMDKLGVASIDSRFPGSPLHPKNGRASYLFNSTIQGIEDADAIMLIGTNPRKEAPVLNARIRKRWSQGDVTIGLIGENAELTYPVTYLGAGPDSLKELVSHAPAKAERPMFIVGQGALNRPDGAGVLATIAAAAKSLGVIRDGWNGFNILHTEAAQVGALDLGFVPGEGGKDTAAMLEPGALDVLFLLGVDEVEVPEGAFRLYQGTHGDRGAHHADVILPAPPTRKNPRPTSTPKAASRWLTGPVSLRARPARTGRSCARSRTLGQKLPFDSLSQLRSKLFEAVPHLAAIDGSRRAIAADMRKSWPMPKPRRQFAGSPMVKDFYLTNPIARASGDGRVFGARRRRGRCEAAE
jgi:NADH-quinone oxidoreductase subunit G